MARYNKSLIFKYAWRVFKAQPIRTEAKFNTCLKEAWYMAKTNPKGLEVEKAMTFDEMYKAYYSNMVNFINLKVKNIEVAEEIADDVFMRTVNTKFDSSKGASVKTWLTKIAIRLVADYFRSKQAIKSGKTINVSDYTDEQGNELFAFETETSTDQLVIGNELLTSINKAIADLSPKYKQVADLFLVQQLSHEEVCEICQLPLYHVKVLINRCKIRLQNQLKREQREYAIAS